MCTQLSDLLRQQMMEAGLTVNDLAFLLDKKYGAVYAIVRGREGRIMSIDFAQKCGIIFKTDPANYLSFQYSDQLKKYPLEPEFKKSLKKKLKELAKIKAIKNKKGAGRKWTN